MNISKELIDEEIFGKHDIYKNGFVKGVEFAQKQDITIYFIASVEGIEWMHTNKKMTDEMLLRLQKNHPNAEFEIDTQICRNEI